MIEKRRTTGPRIGPRLTAPQPAPPPTVMQLGSDRALPDGREVDIAQVRPDPDQPRKGMQPDRLAELAESILRHGLLQPLVVRQEGLAPDGDMQYVIIAGGRRYAALLLLLARPLDDATRARIVRVRVIVNESDAAERRVLQLIENLQREDLSPVEQAHSFKEIMRVERLTTFALAARVHRSQGYIDERLRLLRYEEIEAAVEGGWLTKSAGAAIASLSSADARQVWLARASRGETIRPRDIYASKTPPRDRAVPASPMDSPGLPKFGKPVGEPPVPGDALPKFGNLASALFLPAPNFGEPGEGEAVPDELLPKFGNPDRQALVPDGGLPKFGKPAPVAPLPAADLPNFGKSVVQRTPTTPPLPEHDAVGMPTETTARLPNFGNRAPSDASAVVADGDAITVIRALRMHLATLTLPATPEARAQIAAELEATSVVVQHLRDTLHKHSR